MSLRILYVVPELHLGGSERQLLILAREVKALGHTPRILALRPARRPFPFNDDLDIVTRRLPRPHAVQCFGTYLAEIRRFRPQVIHTFLFGFDFWANLAARLARVPCVVSSRRGFSVWQDWRIRWFQNAGNTLVDGVIANSVTVAEATFRHEAFLNRGQIYSIPNAWVFERIPVDHAPLPMKQGLTFTNVANFWPEKNQEALIRAFVSSDIRAQAHLWLVGDGPGLGPAQALARQLGGGDRVRFLGTRHDIPDILGQTDIYVHASVSESSPNAVLEAMGAGVPVLATACGGVPELLGGGNLGVLVPSCEPAGLKAALRYALAHPADLRERAARAKEAARREHAPRRVAERYLAVYETIRASAGGRRRAAPRHPRLGIYLIGDNSLPSAWFRLFQYVPSLQEAGFALTIFELAPARGERFRQFLGCIRQGIVRWLQLRRARQFDVLLVQKGLSPARWRGLAGTLRRAGVPVVYDFDDAVHLKMHLQLPRPLAWLQNEREPDDLMRLSATVVAGNLTLASAAEGTAPTVVVIPTPIDVNSRYWITPLSRGGAPVVGWSGSSSTNPYVNRLIPTLHQLRSRGIDFSFEILSNNMRDIDPVALSPLPWTFTPWSRESEVANQRRFWMGLMPLPDTAWERGKCALKALQYMALGIPAVCSPVGVNADVIQDGQNGCLAYDSDEWTQKIERLLSDADFRRMTGEAARRTVCEHYSVAGNAQRLIAVLRATQSKGTSSCNTSS